MEKNKRYTIVTSDLMEKFVYLFLTGVIEGLKIINDQ